MSSSSSSSSSSGNGGASQNCYDSLLRHLTRQFRSSGDLLDRRSRAVLDAHNQRCWSDFQLCDLEKHNRLVEGHPMGAPGEYNPLCRVCPAHASADHMCFQFHGDLSVDGLQKLAQIRQAYLDAHKAVREKNDGGRKPERAERDAFVQYAVVAWEFVRPLIVRGLQDPEGGRGPNWNAYHQWCEDFMKDILIRRSLLSPAGMERRTSPVGLRPSVWCFIHQREGLLLPVGGDTFHPECHICPKQDSVQRQTEVKRKVQASIPAANFLNEQQAKHMLHSKPLHERIRPSRTYPRDIDELEQDEKGSGGLDTNGMQL
jgi:hypothetical protein